MFRPIKNLITYIQKNASGASIFGGSTAEAEAEIVTPDTEAAATETAATVKIVPPVAVDIIAEEETLNNEEKDTTFNMNMGKVKIIASNDRVGSAGVGGGVATIRTAAINQFDEDDIETQIKSSIMLRTPIKPKATSGANLGVNCSSSTVTKSTTTITTNTTTTMIRSPRANESKKTHSPLPSPPLIVDEFEDFRHDRTTSDDFCSVGSAELVADEAIEFDCAAEAVQEINEEIVEEIEDDDDEEQFLDLDAFPNSEIIVLNTPDLNCSSNSDALSEDPLALEELVVQPTSSNDSTNPLESPQLCAAAVDDVLWLQIDDDDDVATQSSCANTPTEQATHTAEGNSNSNHLELTEVVETEAAAATSATTITTTTVTDAQQAQATAATHFNSNLNEEHNAEELRSDGSDSGLGSETSALQTTLASSDISQCGAATPIQLTAATTTAGLGVAITDKDTAAFDQKSLHRPPLRSNLKRRLEPDDDDDALDAGDVIVPDCVAQLATLQKKPKRSINFEGVQVYYFPRQQGFGCVPSAGGCTLGMGARHVAHKTLTLAEHAAELRRAHRQQLQQEINPRGNNGAAAAGGSSSDDSEESEEDYLSEGSGSDLDAESSGGFLQPVSPKQRRALLKAAGVRKIDASEKAECRDIRNSREVCGCTCRDFCDPETCACSQAGIKCQVDRAMFPCGCSRDACGNAVGRVEFNPSRVRTHFIHTIMRLEMETRQQQKTPSVVANYGGGGSTVNSSYYGIQQQPASNYSSGYASPAYNSESAQAAYYQPPSLYAENTTQPPTPLSTTQYATVENCLDASLFAAGTTASPAYGEMMPSFGSVSGGITPVAAAYHAPYSSGVQTQLTAYSTAYNHGATSSSYLPLNNNSNDNNSSITNTSSFSSCAVPSAPPFGTATTTAAATQYHNSSSNTSAVVASTAGSNIDININNSSSFISLNTPISSSSRLTAINDLLHNNRNTPAAPPVAVTLAHASNNNCSTSSINTPPIEYAPKSCLAFEQLASPLNPTPIVAVTNSATSAPDVSDQQPPAPLVELLIN